MQEQKLSDAVEASMGEGKCKKEVIKHQTTLYLLCKIVLEGLDSWLVASLYYYVAPGSWGRDKLLFLSFFFYS